MGVNIGGINIAEAIINLEYGLARTQKILDELLRKNPNILPLDASEIKKIEDEIYEIVKNKYPEAGIIKKGA